MDIQSDEYGNAALIALPRLGPYLWDGTSAFTQPKFQCEYFFLNSVLKLGKRRTKKNT
jgi:hypothetical protein